MSTVNAGSHADGAFIVATLNPLPASIRATTITWRTVDNAWAEVWVAVDDGPETLFVEGPTGFKLAPWIQPGHRYDFRLYAGKDHRELLSNVTVTRHAAAAR